MLNIDEVKKLAKLTRIDVSDDELRELHGDLEHILEYVSVLERLSLTKKDLEIVEDNRNVMREDIAPHESDLYTDDLLKNAPKITDRYISVDKVIKND
jgi:aspartyl-tRNA(Asn)/glutamyl-tRNA(Gln) amidotransferase subunit C